MNSTKLKEDLSNCLINFDRRVLITELLEDYRLPYEEVNTIVQNYLDEQEHKLKFEKRYLVHGLQEDEQKKEIYKIVEEQKLKEWLNRLKNAESSLYSVEIAGGAKSAAPVFKPMRVEECKKATRQKAKISTGTGEANCATVSVERKEVKIEKNVGSKIKESPKEEAKSISKESAPTKKISPKTETSLGEKKIVDKTSTGKKGIQYFFKSSTANSKKSDEKKTSSEVPKPITPKKMQDIFKKQTEKPAIKGKVENKTANISVQLFDEEENEPEVESSDEEENLEALKRDIISSDVELEKDDESKATTSVKRRRILDSDDEEEDPPVKHEKLLIKEEAKDEVTVPETYLDEEGFVITKKPKQKAATTTKKSPAAKKAPPVTMKTPKKESKKSNSSSNMVTKAGANPAAKTKQAGIMNFFSKK